MYYKKLRDVHEAGRAINITYSEILFGSLLSSMQSYEGWNFNSGNYLFTTDTK